MRQEQQQEQDRRAEEETVEDDMDGDEEDLGDRNKPIQASIRRWMPGKDKSGRFQEALDKGDKAMMRRAALEELHARTERALESGVRYHQPKQ